MRSTLRRRHLAFVLLALGLLGCKAAYLSQVGPRSALAFWSVLDEAALVCALGWGMAGAGRWTRWPGRVLEGLALAVLGLSTLVYALVLVGLSVLGSFPRLQQLQGLTWKMIGPSVVPMLQQQRWVLVGAGVGVAAAGLAFSRARVPSVRVPRWLALGVTAVVALGELGASRAGRRVVPVTERLLLGRALLPDLEAAPLGALELARETAFFRAHDARLAEERGPSPLYGDLIEGRRGGDVIFVSLESVRALDLAPWGGPEHLPFLDSLLPHAVVLQRMYAQDVRSTKTFAAFDLGVYELTSWESYSHGLTDRFGPQSLAAQLGERGYRTVVMVNGDPSYDENAAFHLARGYHEVLYQPDLNPGSGNSDDARMLQRVDEVLDKSAGQPLFLFTWPLATHHPYGRDYWADMEGWRARHPQGIEHKGAEDKARYLAALRETDDYVRQLWGLLEKHGRAERATLVLVGDHGEAFGEHDPHNVFHGNDLYEESVRVAALVYSPRLKGGVDGRAFMTKDVAASLLELGGGPPVLGQGRSFFRDWVHPMPVYLFNSFTRVAGIIEDGWKYRFPLDRPGVAFLASMEEVERNPDVELRAAGQEARAGQLRARLDEWLDAMGTRTRRLLAEAQRPAAAFAIVDTFRVYCDEGQGFTEAAKGLVAYRAPSSTATTVDVRLDRSCRALRLAPLQRTETSADRNLHFDLGTLEVTGAGGAVRRDLRYVQALNADGDSVRGFTFMHVKGASACLDFALADQPVPLSRVRVSFTFTATERHAAAIP